MINYKLHLVMARQGRLKMVDVARKAGISLQAVRRVYHGTAERIDRSTLDKLCKALDCQPGDLLEYVPDEKEHSERG